MKIFIVILLGSLALVQAEIDWSKVFPNDIFATPAFQPPTLTDTHIVGGEEVVPNSIPYQVALLLTIGGRVGFCGGALISPNCVLTAAHCVESASSVEVVMGAHKVNDASEKTQVRMNTTNFKYHEKWSNSTLQNDIAVVKLPTPVEFNAYIQPVKLPTRALGSIDKETVVVSGWGKESDQAKAISPVLKSITVPVLPNARCRWFFMGTIQETHMCTRSEGGKSTCNGDSGGPAVLKRDRTLVALVSFGISLGCSLGWPAAYTRVSSYLDWIEQNSDVTII